MTKIVNGAIFVDAFTPTSNAGEYTFINALFNNQADSGDGAAAILPGFVIYIQASDINTFSIIPGVSCRYKLTSVTIINNSTLSGTIMLDSGNIDAYVPTNGVYSILSQTTLTSKLGVPAIDSYYPDLVPGSTLAALLSDTVQIVDVIATDVLHPMQGVSGKSYSFSNSSLWTIKHNMLTVNFIETITNSAGERIYAGITTVDNTEFLIEFTEPISGSVTVMFV